MFLVTPEMNRIVELLAFIVATYFPVALLTWLVIDKFFATEKADGRSGHRPQARQQPKHTRAGHPRPEA
jgi:hypothetical protein